MISTMMHTKRDTKVVPWMINKQDLLKDDSEYTDKTELMEDSDDESEYSEYSSDEESVLDDLEQELLCFDLKQVRRRAKAPNARNNSLDALLANSSENKRPELHRASSMDLFERMALANKRNSYFQDPNKGNEDVSDAPRPAQFLKEKLSTQYTTESTFQSKTWEAYFTAVTPERMAAHSLVVASAIRKADLDELKQLVAQGARLDGCNRQGESSMHLACRLNQLPVIEFLTQEAKVSVRVRDDCGRTPLHDACWTNTPNFELVHYILDQSVELLFLEDHRGYTALHYVPACASKAWCDWIVEHQEWLQQKVHTSSWLKASEDLDQAQMRMRKLMARAQNYMAVVG